MDMPEQMLIQAIEENDIELLRYWIAKGANPNKINSKGKTPLGVAAQHGNFLAFKTLAESQKHVIKYLSNNTSLEGNRRTLNLDLTVDNKQNKNIGYFVVCKDMEENELGEGPTPDGMEALEWDTEIKEDNMDKDCLCSTPPEAKIYKWYADVLNRSAVVLQSPENDIARYDKFGLNVLHYAVVEGHRDIVEYLLENFKEFNANQNDQSMLSPLQIAIHGGHEKIIKLLIEKGGNVNFINRLRQTPLHMAAERGFVDVLKILIDNGANVNILDAADRTALSHAVSFMYEEAAVVLIKNGTNLNLEELGGWTVLQRAVMNNMTRVVKLLLLFGAKIIQSHFLLHKAIKHKNLEMVEALHRAGAFIEFRDDAGKTPLMFSCIYHSYEITEYLLQHGARPNAQHESNGLTALHFSLESLVYEDTFKLFLELMLAYNADINAKSYLGNVLMYSMIVNNYDASCVLVKYGANVNGGLGYVDCLLYAINHVHLELAKLIIYAGYDINEILSNIKRLKSRTGCDTVINFLVYITSKPLTLRELCRIRIRSILGRNLIPKIYKLPLPNVLFNYLALEEL